MISVDYQEIDRKTYRDHGNAAHRRQVASDLPGLLVGNLHRDTMNLVASGRYPQ